MPYDRKIVLLYFRPLNGKHRSACDKITMNFRFIAALLCLISTHVLATFDLSNLDAKNFEYFKYNPTTTKKPIFFRDIHGGLYSIRKIPEKPSKFEDTKNRVKAVFSYFKTLFMSDNKHRIRSQHIIDPELPKYKSETFQAKHGKHAVNLVDLLGRGPSYSLVRAGVV